MVSELAPVIDYSHYLSTEAVSHQLNPLKALRYHLTKPGIISFGGGLPHPSTWPVNAMTVSVPFVGRSIFIPGYQSPTPDSLEPLTDYVLPKSDDPSPNLTSELQYSGPNGAPHLVSWLSEHVRRVHAPPYAGWKVFLTAGNTDGIDGVIRTVCNPGEHVLVEEFAFPGLLTRLASQNIKAIGVPMDGDGLMASALDDIMAQWDQDTRGGPRPKLIVLVPTCSNPAGVTIPQERKRDIYAVCRKWKLLIAEDDPYYFLQIRDHGADTPVVTSFLSLDVDGRVVRIDSFSKILAPGSRLGYISGPKILVDKIINSREGSTGSPSGFSMAAVSAVLRAWGGHEGFERVYLPHISDVYKKRCLSMVSLLETYLPTAAAVWPSGSGGMFLWVKLKMASHPEFADKTLEQLTHQLFQTCVDERVIVAPSFYFQAPSIQTWSKEDAAERTFIRLSFSQQGPDEMEEGVKRLARALRKEWHL